VTTPDRDDLDDFAELLPTARCRGKCGEDYIEAELVDGLCPDCRMTQRKQKRKVYKECPEKD
jgi:hypothetical protein